MMKRSAQDQEFERLSAERSHETVRVERGPLQRDFLQFGFQPREWDVICHSGKDSKSHVGNRRFKVLVQNYLSSYLKAESKMLKSAVIKDIIKVIRSKSTENGGFVRYDEKAKLWYEVGDKVARDKVGHALREAMRNVEEPEAATVPSAPASAAESLASGLLAEATAVPSAVAASESSPTIIIPDKIGQPSSCASKSAIPVQKQSSGSMETVSGGAQSDKEELTPVGMNLADWFEADSMDAT